MRGEKIRRLTAVFGSIYGLVLYKNILVSDFFSFFFSKTKTVSESHTQKGRLVSAEAKKKKKKKRERARERRRKRNKYVYCGSINNRTSTGGLSVELCCIQRVEPSLPLRLRSRLNFPCSVWSTVQPEPQYPRKGTRCCWDTPWGTVAERLVFRTVDPTQGARFRG